ncbi:MAG: carbamoyltransferase HypF [Phycisphaerae bacterium]|nr:carbamoyltransferase HypF [Phycisphaerae bacterium]
MAAEKVQRIHLAIRGQVQGVGFRPFVYRLATQLELTGHVANDSRGVHLEEQGAPEVVEMFCRRLTTELPPLATVAGLDRRAADVVPGEGAFRILPSEAGELADAQVTVDTAVCAACLAELADPADPRYRYPFINCTNCGPRYTLVRRIPYDRPHTTMAEFPMCSLCAREYSDPACRRFHAQPVACPRCGPSVWLVDPRGRQIVCDDAIAAAADMLRDGRILAIKGLGGFHLACRADDDHLVGRLRRRKQRDEKPFAIMVADLAAAEKLVALDDAARQLLTGPVSPIVLLPRRAGAPVAAGVAEGMDCLAVMLPYTPLHHLLFACGLPAMVMTSGNISDEPLVKDNDAAIAHLSPIADALLLHNRPIERRIDDSVVQHRPAGQSMVARRARGYAPTPVALRGLAEGAPAILAVGAELKNTVCLLAHGRCVLSEHIGDLTDGRTYRHFIDTINHLEALFDVCPEMLAADMHPQYLSTQYAARRHRGELPGRSALPLVAVQHHHAHIASCLAEHGRGGPVVGLACDGTGFGPDGTVWGCEVLSADLTDFRRLGHLRYLPLPGGDAAAVETWRAALAVLFDAYGDRCLDVAERCRLAAPPEAQQTVVEMLSMGANCPPASSLGRWFDAVAALAGVAAVNGYEAQAAMRLEAIVQPGMGEGYPYQIVSSGPFEIDLRPMVCGLVDDVLGGVAAGVIAGRFHNTVVGFLAESARRAREATGLGVVALSGGCFANRYLSARLEAKLTAEGFEVLVHRSVPCNDGGVALGQAAVAAARWAQATGARAVGGRVGASDVSGDPRKD